MKLHSAICSIFAAILLCSDASASDLHSIAYVEQITTASAQSLSRMTTEDIAGPMLQTAARLSSLRPAQGNLGLAWQEGDGNNSTIVQDGIGNIALVRQIGLANTASISQSGSGHQAMILQQGRGNVAIISQR
jgi:hypothetical protein